LSGIERLAESREEPDWIDKKKKLLLFKYDSVSIYAVQNYQDGST